MKKYLFLIVIAVFIIPFFVFAQKNEIHFHSINTFAAVGGQSEVNTAFQTVNGIQFSNWFTGIGVGVDNYVYKTLPLFFDARRFFGNEKRGFVYGDIGYDFPLKNKPGKEIFRYDTYDFTGGIYTDIGMGYQFPIYKRSFFVLSLGYSYKKLQSKIGTTICPFVGPCVVDYSNYEFSYGRMILKAGLIF
jgi:hypothetical protein